MVRGATPDVVLTGGRAARPRLDAERPGAGTWWSSTSAAPPPTCTRSSSSTRRTPGWPARWSPPCRSPAPSRATSACAGAPSRPSRRRRGRAARRRRPAAAAADARRADPAFLPGDRRPSATRTSAIAAAAVGLALRRHAGRSQVVVSPRGPGRRAQRQGPARGRPAGRLGRRAAARPRRASPTGCSARSPATTSPGGWQLPRAPRVVVDRDYVLAAAGLLAARAPARRAHAPARPPALSRDGGRGIA